MRRLGKDQRCHEASLMAPAIALAGAKIDHRIRDDVIADYVCNCDPQLHRTARAALSELRTSGTSPAHRPSGMIILQLPESGMADCSVSWMILDASV